MLSPQERFRTILAEYSPRPDTLPTPLPDLDALKDQPPINEDRVHPSVRQILQNLYPHAEQGFINAGIMFENSINGQPQPTNASQAEKLPSRPQQHTYQDELSLPPDPLIGTTPIRTTLYDLAWFFNEKDETWDDPTMRMYISALEQELCAVISGLDDLSHDQSLSLGQSHTGFDGYIGKTYTTLAGRTARLLVGSPPTKYLFHKYASALDQLECPESDTLDLLKIFTDYHLNIDINSLVPSELHSIAINRIARQLLLNLGGACNHDNLEFDKPYTCQITPLAIDKTRNCLVNSGTSQNLSIVFDVIKPDSLQKQVSILRVRLTPLISTDKHPPDQTNSTLTSYLIFTDPAAITAHDSRHGPPQSNLQRLHFHFGLNSDGEPTSFIPPFALEEKRTAELRPTFIESPHYDSLLSWVNAVTRMAVPKLMQLKSKNLRVSPPPEQLFEATTLTNLRHELTRLIANSPYPPDFWHNSEVFTQLQVCLLTDYEHSITLFCETGLLGDLMFPQLQKIMEEKSLTRSALADLLIEQSDTMLANKLNLFGPVRLVNRLRELIKFRFSREGTITQLLDEWNLTANAPPALNIETILKDTMPIEYLPNLVSM